MMIKKYTLAVLIGALAFVGYACDSNSSGNDDDEVEAIVGTWVSEGASNVALGLQIVSKTARIDADFNSNGTYNVVSTDSAGSEVVFTGTYELGEETTSGIRSITLQQSEPTAVVSAGIFQVEGNNMTYEVIQVEPNIGAEAPTVGGGFGSTLVGGEAQGDLWVQQYVRQ
jgi:hypothetical protein